MKRKILRATCIALSAALLFFALGGTSAEEKESEIQLIETGEFHGEEVTAETGEQWLGLFPAEKGFALLLSTVAIDAVYDPIVDSNESERSGKKVSVIGNDKPIFLLKGADNLRAGPIATVFSEEKNLGNGASIDLRLGGKEYQLKVASENPEPSEYLAQKPKLLLTRGQTTQVLISLDEHNDAAWTLLWAGDIDGDGDLDLYLDLSHHYNVSVRTLFLSNGAGKGKLVKEFAAFTTSGC